MCDAGDECDVDDKYPRCSFSLICCVGEMYLLLNSCAAFEVGGSCSSVCDGWCPDEESNGDWLVDDVS